MLQPRMEQPCPDFSELKRVLTGEQPPRRVHLVELLMDQEVMQLITTRYLEEPGALPANDAPSEAVSPEIYLWSSAAARPDKRYIEQLIQVYYRLGYDYVPVWPLWLNHPPAVRRHAGDTASLSKGQRGWVDHYGLITSWEDFEKFPWDSIRPDYSLYQVAAANLPEGMKIVAGGSLFEHVMKHMLGYEGLFYMLYDEPDLIAQIFDRWGQILYDFYASIVEMEAVGAIFHGDDMGFRTATMVSPESLRRHIFPWHKKYVDLAHAHGKMFWLHSCGNLFDSVFTDLVEEVGIDAYHSFQDLILPIADFQDRYGDRVAALGGVDMDKLASLDELPLRQYIRDILDRCMPRGRFALGSGNTIANYIPLQNYFIMLDESRRWQPPG